MRIIAVVPASITHEEKRQRRTIQTKMFLEVHRIVFVGLTTGSKSEKVTRICPAFFYTAKWSFFARSNVLFFCYCWLDDTVGELLDSITEPSGLRYVIQDVAEKAARVWETVQKKAVEGRSPFLFFFYSEPTIQKASPLILMQCGLFEKIYYGSPSFDVF